jgi:hypothetical protein
MADKIKTILAFIFFMGALIASPLVLLVGWWQNDAKSGFLWMIIVFLVMITLGGTLLLRVRDLSWVSVYMPYIFGAVYGFLPDTIPFSLDDAAATTAGSIFTFALALKKQSKTPKWIVIPLLFAGIYALLGGYLPGPVDELLVDTLALILAWFGSRHGKQIQGQNPVDT